MTVCLFSVEEEQLYFYFDRPIDTNDRFEAGGFTVDVLEPARQLRTTYNGASPGPAEPRGPLQPERGVQGAASGACAVQNHAHRGRPRSMARNPARTSAWRICPSSCKHRCGQ